MSNASELRFARLSCDRKLHDCRLYKTLLHYREVHDGRQQTARSWISPNIVNCRRIGKVCDRNILALTVLSMV